MTIDALPEPAGDPPAVGPAPVALEAETLYAVIGVVASSPNLERVLDEVVCVLSQATGSHACFVYLRDGARLRLRAASSPFSHLVGRVQFGLDEGLAGWVVRTGSPAFIPDDALADPRMKYVPELREERFQSLAAVPILARSGESIGVVVLHTVAPHEFDEGVLTLVSHTASLVSGAIENAQLYEDSRRRVDALTKLSALSEQIAAVTGREALNQVVSDGVRGLLRCERCELFLFDIASGRLEAASDGSPASTTDGATMLVDLLRRAPEADRSGDDDAPLAVPVAAGEETLGVLVAHGRQPFDPADDELLRSVANQLAVALKRAELIARLTAENIVRDLFEAMAADDDDVAQARARAAGCDVTREQLCLHVERAEKPGDQPWPELAERIEARLRRLSPGAICDVGRDHLRALLASPRPPGPDGAPSLLVNLAEVARQEAVVVGVATPRVGVRDGKQRLMESADAARVARTLMLDGGVLSYAELGAYRYLVRLPADAVPQDRYCHAIRRLAAYDARRRADLVATLEQHLRHRRSVAGTARALYIHPNTLRQRLDRIEELSGLDLATEDLLSVELAIKFVRLRPDLEGAAG